MKMTPKQVKRPKYSQRKEEDKEENNIYIPPYIKPI
jgi:hypothetical protein